MAQYMGIKERLAQSAVLPQDALPGVPIVEICGENRVLIEGHKGVIEYGNQLIQVVMSYGRLKIIGCSLSLAHMSKEKLVVTGQIFQVCLCRR